MQGVYGGVNHPDSRSRRGVSWCQTLGRRRTSLRITCRRFRLYSASPHRFRCLGSEPGSRVGCQRLYFGLAQSHSQPEYQYCARGLCDDRYFLQTLPIAVIGSILLDVRLTTILRRSETEGGCCPQPKSKVPKTTKRRRKHRSLKRSFSKEFLKVSEKIMNDRSERGRVIIDHRKQGEKGLHQREATGSRVWQCI
jgi:hypothetical protein